VISANRCAASLILLLSLTGPSVAGEQKIVLQEHLKQEWKSELVTYPFEAEKGQCHPDSIRLSGPKGPVPVQVSDVVCWPRSALVKSAKLSFIVDLAPLANDTYTVRYGPKPSKTPQPETDLKVTREKGYVEFVTSKFGVRLIVGQKTYRKPVKPSKAPRPVVAMRLPDKPEGTWFGGSRLYGDKKITACEATLTAAGPVFGQVAIRYTYEDGTTMDLTARLAAGDAQVRYEMNVLPLDPEQAVKDLRSGWAAEDPLRPKDPATRNGWRLLLSTGLDPLRLVAVPEFGKLRWGKHVYVGGKWVDDPVDVEIEKEPTGTLVNLVPWNDWWAQSTKTRLTLKSRDRGPVLTAEALNPGEWVEPDKPGTWTSWSNRRMCQKWIPLVHAGNGETFFQISLASGRRTFLVGGAAKPLGRKLNVLKDYILEWEPGKLGHPHLFLNAKQLAEARKRKPDPKLVEHLVNYGRAIQPKPHHSDCGAVGAWLLTGDPKVAKEVKLVERLRHHLNLLGNFDRMRSVFLLCGLYDAVMGSDLITEADRKALRAQMAYVAYLIADPATWSMERGYCSGNLNMSVSHVLNQGILACTLADHPKARAWLASGQAMLEQMLATKVGPDGEWPESVSNYAYVSTSALLPLAVAAKNAGFADYVNDPRMKRLMLYLAKQYTPADPRHTEINMTGKMGLLPPVGRGGAGGRNGLQGLMARATAKSDPDYSAHQQWTWLRAGQPMGIPDSRLGGWEHVYMSPDLPAKTPDWELDVFGRTGVIMRHGIGTPHEWYVYVMCEQDFAYPAESGGFPVIFARGKPISARFSGGYAEREEILISRVLPARPRGEKPYRLDHFTHNAKRKIAAANSLPRQQYVRIDQTIGQPKHISHERGAFDKMKPLPTWPAVAKEGQPPFDWARQVLFVRDAKPDGPGYLVLRDTVTGGQPTMWQFWTVSEKIGTPKQLADRKAFLADAPGEKATDARPLPSGDRYTAVGQHGVDVEFFIASPAQTPRHTLRWGVPGYGYSPVQYFREFQDMLHLQRPGDGAYYIVVFPRKPAEPEPTFKALADGKIIQIAGPWGTDHAFLSAEKAVAKADGVVFSGTAASVRRYAGGETVLSLGAKGIVSAEPFTLQSPHACSLQATKRELIVCVPGDFPGGRIALAAPGEWKVETPETGVQLQQQSLLGYGLTLPAGKRRVTMIRP